LAFGPKLDFKNICQAQAGIGFQNEARLQLWFQRFNNYQQAQRKPLQKGKGWR